ncbi:MAG TPA: amidinotransferase, partial [Isosphaeraceae bacterium]
MSTPRILMCPPDFYGIEYEINPWMNRKVGADHARATEQWRTLRDILVALGATIELMDPVPGLPDLVFTANAGLVYGNRFIGSRFRHGVRQGESPHYEDFMKVHGFEAVSLPAMSYFEGAGDALFCGETLLAGYRFRSDARSHQWIGQALGVEV